MANYRLVIPRPIYQAACIIFVVAVPLFLIAASVTWAVNDSGLYRRGFEKYDIANRSGITEADLIRVGGELRRYFNSGEEPLRVIVPVYGLDRELYNHREVEHMRDVKVLVRGTYLVAAISGFYLLGLTAAAYALCRAGFAGRLARLSIWGGGLTLGIVAAVGLFALVGFDSLFLLFHQISFSNDLWQLDPRTDYLLIMFPQGFWFDATMRVALTTIAGALLIAAAGGGYVFSMKKRGRGKGDDEGNFQKAEGP